MGNNQQLFPIHLLHTFNSFCILLSNFFFSHNSLQIPHFSHKILVYLISNLQLYLYSDFTVSLWGRITVPCFHLILYWFHNSSWYSIFGFDNFLILKLCFQRTLHKIYFQDHLPHGHLKSSIYKFKLITLWFVPLDKDRYGFAFMNDEFYLPLSHAYTGVYKIILQFVLAIFSADSCN